MSFLFLGVKMAKIVISLIAILIGVAIVANVDFETKERCENVTVIVIRSR